jgi:hypothetical protein
MVGESMSRVKVGPFSLKLHAGSWQEGFAHDCLVAGDRRRVGFTFFEISSFDEVAMEVQGQLSAMVWMPMTGAQELHRQLGEALAQLEFAAEGEVVSIDHSPKKRPSQQGGLPPQS